MPSTRASSISRSTVASVSLLATAAECETGADFRAEARAPAPFVLLEAARAEAVVAEGLCQHAGRETACQEAVVDAAAGRRLDEPGGIADGEDAISPRSRHGTKRQHAQARRRPRLRNAVRGANRLRERLEPGACVALAEQAHPRKRRPAPFKRDNPRESSGRDLPSEVHLHLIERRKRHFELSAVDEHARHAETEHAVEAIARAARQDGGTCFDSERRRRPSCGW